MPPPWGASPGMRVLASAAVLLLASLGTAAAQPCNPVCTIVLKAEGNCEADVAVCLGGNSEATLLAVSGDGNSESEGAAVALAGHEGDWEAGLAGTADGGNAQGGLAAASLCGNADGGVAALSAFGHADGLAALGAPAPMAPC